MTYTLAEKKHQVIAVLRRVAKAVDKVWNSALRYKLQPLGLPTILEKTLCTSLDNRIANI